MHTILKAALLALALATPALATPVLAAPTCQSTHGDTIRCGTEGAMPVGWTLPPEQARERAMFSATSSLKEVLKVAWAFGLFLAFIALLPEFDGSRAGDWDRQEDDDTRR